MAIAKYCMARGGALAGGLDCGMFGRGRVSRVCVDVEIVVLGFAKAGGDVDVAADLYFRAIYWVVVIYKYHHVAVKFCVAELCVAYGHVTYAVFDWAKAIGFNRAGEGLCAGIRGGGGE